jgi:hypothetical protein
MVRNHCSPLEQSMQIQINTDHNLKIHDSESAQLKRLMEDTLDRFSAHITRLELHLSDEDASRSGRDDKRCLIEARQEHRKPIAVSHNAATLIQAVSGAADKLARSLETDIGRLRDLRRHQATPNDEEPAIPVK